MRSVIKSVKHYVQVSKATITSGAVSTSDIVDGTSVAAVGAATDEVEEGSLVKAVYVEMWIGAGGPALGSCVACIEKRPSGSPVMTTTNMLNLAAYPNKKNILQTFQGLTPHEDTYPTPIFKGWVKIPKGKQRIGLGDKIVLNIYAVSGGGEICGFFTYKEYS